ncbi:MAG: NOB1 family endonuclease [Thermoplasmatota archaeon]
MLILDTSLLLGGKEPPQGEIWATTPEAEAEISRGGKDARRFENWRHVGLQIRSAGSHATEKVQAAAMQAGNLGRLSEADVSLIALALQESATLVTDDMTMLDIASRLSVSTQTINTKGITGTKNWQPRCTGCGRWFDVEPKDCPICGSEVVLRVRHD